MLSYQTFHNNLVAFHNKNRNCISFVGSEEENQMQCLILIVAMRLVGQLSMNSVINCNYSELHANCGKGYGESEAMSNFN